MLENKDARNASNIIEKAFKIINIQIKRTNKEEHFI